MWYIRPVNPQSDQSLCLSIEYSISFKLLTENYLECLSLKVGCTCSSESTLVKMPHCWKSHVTAHLLKFSLALFLKTLPMSTITNVSS